MVRWCNARRTGRGVEGCAAAHPTVWRITDAATCEQTLAPALDKPSVGAPDELERRALEALVASPADSTARDALEALWRRRAVKETGLAAFRDALALRPDGAGLLANLGIALKALGRIEDAVACYDRALAIRPDCASAHYNRGIALKAMDRPAEAIASYERALAIQPAYAQALNNMGNAFRALNRHAEAIVSFDRALALRPGYGDAQFGRALSLLALGDLGVGWPGFERRWERRELAPDIRDLRKPVWLGDPPVAGKSVLLHSEQGMGDTLQFVRYATVLAARGATVHLEVQAPLKRLLASVPGTNSVVARGEALPRFDLHCPLMSLPLACGTTLETIPARIPYVRAPKALAEGWAMRLDGAGPKVGLAWAGNPAHANDRNRSIPMALLQPLLALPGIRFVSLQKPGSGARAGMAELPGHVLDASADLRDFADTAALVENLDLVIAVDTAVAHLAGAVGRPMWLLLPFAADWRWLLEREDSPWYPTARLFRQPAVGDWRSVIDRVRGELQTWQRRRGADSAARTGAGRTPRPTDAIRAPAMGNDRPTLRPAASAPKGWHDVAHGLWERGERLGGVQAALANINAFGADKPRALVLQLAYYFFLLDDFPAAARTLEYQAGRTPNDPEVLLNLAACYSRIGRDADAADRANAVLAAQPDNALALDVLAKCLHALGRHREAADAGTRALVEKDRACVGESAAEWRLPSADPRAYARGPGRRDVIAFSLWGARPEYLRGALRNLLLAPDLFPGWLLRFYIDDTVPPQFVELIREHGGEVFEHASGQTLRQKLCWRFGVANDPGVGHFLVRDVDSVIGARELRCVQAWLDSDKWFHVIRDWWTHTDLVLAGMWGGVAGVLPSMPDLLARYSPRAVETPNVDQWFLRDVVWAYMRQSCLVHDRCFRMDGSMPPPDREPKGNYHIGQDEFAARRRQQERILRPWIERYPCLGEAAASE